MIDKVASLLRLPPENLNKVVLVHFMIHLLIYSAEDRDQRTWARHESNGESLEALVHYYSSLFYRLYEYKELAYSEGVFVRYLPAAGRDTRELDCLSREQVNAAMIFWRRRPDLCLREILRYLQDFS